MNQDALDPNVNDVLLTNICKSEKKVYARTIYIAGIVWRTNLSKLLLLISLPGL